MARDTFVWWYHWTRTGRAIADHIEVLVVESFRDSPGWTTLLVLSTSHFIPLSSLLCPSQSFPLCPMSIIGHWRNILPLKICLHDFCSFNIILRMPSMWKASLCILSDCIVCRKNYHELSWQDYLPTSYVLYFFLLPITFFSHHADVLLQLPSWCPAFSIFHAASASACPCSLHFIQIYATLSK